MEVGNLFFFLDVFRFGIISVLDLGFPLGFWVNIGVFNICIFKVEYNMLIGYLYRFGKIYMLD